MPTPAPPVHDLRSDEERSARLAVVETCQRRGVDPGYFLLACAECGRVVMGSRICICDTCIVRATMEGQLSESLAYTPRSATA